MKRTYLIVSLLVGILVVIGILLIRKSKEMFESAPGPAPPLYPGPGMQPAPRYPSPGMTPAPFYPGPGMQPVPPTPGPAPILPPIPPIFPRPAKPYVFKQGSIMINNKSYTVKFIKTEISKGVYRDVMITVDSTIVPIYRISYIDALTGKFVSLEQLPVKNMIYLDGSTLKSGLGNKFVLGQVERMSIIGLKANSKGKTITVQGLKNV